MDQDRKNASGNFKVAILGCGFVCDSYIHNLEKYPAISVAAVCDRIEERAKKVGRRVNAKVYTELSTLLQDTEIDGIINLTNPRDHFDTTKLCLEAGKHVYVEKPLGMDVTEANALVELAHSLNLHLSIAPCSVLSPSAQVLWKAIREGKIGKVHLVYANFEDGMIAPHHSPWNWENSFGAPWPAKDEFEVGCTFEHAGYFLTWLVCFFGSVRSATTFSSIMIEDKGIPVDGMAPDFTCGCLEFDENIVARVTCGLVAPRDKSMTIVGDKGTLHIENLRDDYGKVWHAPYHLEGKMARNNRLINGLRRRLSKVLPEFILEKLKYKGAYALDMPPEKDSVEMVVDKRADFLRGPMEWISAIQEERSSRLPGELGAHMVEIINELQYPSGSKVPMKTKVLKIEPLLQD